MVPKSATGRRSLGKGPSYFAHGSPRLVLEFPADIVRGEDRAFDANPAEIRRTVRLADRICVIDDGKVVELGSHDELMQLGGRYRTLFDLQASRFTEYDDHGEEVTYESLL